jgi:hypothetical protein
MESKLEEDDVTDLALMWEEASIQYYNTIQMNPTDLKRFKSVDDILEDRDIQNNFQRVFNRPLYVALHFLTCQNSGEIMEEPSLGKRWRR